MQVSAASSTGNGLSFMVGRVSYSLGLVGPCIGLDTACSSSLVRTCFSCAKAYGDCNSLTFTNSRVERVNQIGADISKNRGMRCCSSQVTTHLAHRALLDGEASAAVTAGVNVMFSPLITAAICQLQVRLLHARWQLVLIQLEMHAG